MNTDRGKESTWGVKIRRSENEGALAEGLEKERERPRWEKGNWEGIGIGNCPRYSRESIGAKDNKEKFPTGCRRGAS